MPVMLKSTPGASIHPKFKDFLLTDIQYKTVHGIPIPATILLPTHIAHKPGRYPVAIRWHGGGFGTGHRLYGDWYASFILELYKKHNAIGITVDYRLAPEANGMEILQDLKDFYTWLFAPASNLAAALPEGVEPDLTSVLVSGESAGGWLAIQSALTQPAGRFAAVIAQYAMIDLRDGHYTQHYHKQIFGCPQYDAAEFHAYVASLKGDEVVSSRSLPSDEAAQQRTITMFQQGLYARFFGRERELYPLEMLDGVAYETPIWVLHGERDSAVPIEGSKKLVEKLKGGKASVHTSFVEGEEHGFDLLGANGQQAGLETTTWVKEGVEFIERFWPKRQ
ncbi:alpha beta-hydrolase [Lecanosticta acicola]|uniref:Alpha beta-hydrolase n=1 Tax=Lecanosticta acicola TaxID=111012 RepID=A0AAI8Z4T6_9PEZI|nr:alpha beta-hydrolase [Lecanosticta acicola]